MSDDPIKRILVALDSSATNKSTLQVATALASKLKAQLQALFVEDINLIHLAELPFAREVSASTHTARQLTLADMEKQLSGQVRRLRQMVDQAALQSQLAVEFKVLRGPVASELCMAVQQMDLLIVGKNTQLLRHSEKLGSITRDMLTGSKCSLLLLQHGASLERPVAVVYTGSETSRRALQLGAQLAQGDHDQLSVLYPQAPAASQQKWQDEVTTFAHAHDIMPKHICLKENNTPALLNALAACNGRILLLAADQDTFPAEQLQSLLQQSTRPVILIR